MVRRHTPGESLENDLLTEIVLFDALPQDDRYRTSITSGRGASGLGADERSLLAALPAATGESLRRRMTRVPLKRWQVLQERHVALSHAYFIEGGVASLVAKIDDCATVEVRTLGAGDLVGLPIVLGTTRSPHRCVVHATGSAMQIPADALIAAIDEFPELRRLLLAYVQSALVHSSQLAACSTRHNIKQRLARRLLVMVDHLPSHDIAITQASLGRALGVRRPSITRAICNMEQVGLIEHRRGEIRILDRAGLEEASCHCYQAIRAAQERVASTAHAPWAPRDRMRVPALLTDCRDMSVVN
jgi:CRP-like cAMP-binding protein